MNIDSPSAAHAPTHGGFPSPPPEPTMLECAHRLGFETVAEMVEWAQYAAVVNL